MNANTLRKTDGCGRYGRTTGAYKTPRVQVRLAAASPYPLVWCFLLTGLSRGGELRLRDESRVTGLPPPGDVSPSLIILRRQPRRQRHARRPCCLCRGDNWPNYSY